jgi:arginine-tRNA-protein transferase
MEQRDPSVELAVGAACPYPAWEPPIKIRLSLLPDHRCTYLPQRVAQTRAFWAEQMPAGVYHALMDAGFRRSGKLIYQPVCKGCRKCLPIRVPLATFKASKSQRRCARRNADLIVNWGPLEATDEKWELYQRYVTAWHGGAGDDRAGFEAFLYDSPVDTIEFSYRNSTGRLLAVGICDVYSDSLSSVYFYFDPGDAERCLGTFGALYELEFARDQKIPYYYLGYWIDQCPSMSYKAKFQTHEILHPDNVWRSGAAEGGNG